MRVIGAPFNSSGRLDGVAKAPQALRDAGLIDQLRQPSWATSRPFVIPADPANFPTANVHDVGDVDVGVLQPERDSRCGLRALDSLEVTTSSIRRAVADSLIAGEYPLVIGGDCPVLLGSLRGAADVFGEIGLLFVDGHEDAWPPALSTTGEAADCELGLALGLYREDLPRSLLRLLPTLDPRAVVALGPRDADELVRHAVPTLADKITLRVAGNLGTDVDASATDATAHILRQVKHWWLHIDLDVLSNEAFAAADYLQPGGLSWSQLESLTVAALHAPGCVGITLCIYNPDLDPGCQHARRIVDYLGRLAASRYRAGRLGT